MIVTQVTWEKSYSRLWFFCNNYDIRVEYGMETTKMSLMTDMMKEKQCIHTMCCKLKTKLITRKQIQSVVYEPYSHLKQT